jgi:PhnB protein
LYNQAVAAGVKVERPLKDQFYGDRSGTVKDPFGHTWTIATHKEDVSLEEMQKRMKEMTKQAA